MNDLTAIIAMLIYKHDMHKRMTGPQVPDYAHYLSEAQQWIDGCRKHYARVEDSPHG